MTLDTSLPPGAAAASAASRGDSYTCRIMGSPRENLHALNKWDPAAGSRDSVGHFLLHTRLGPCGLQPFPKLNCHLGHRNVATDGGKMAVSKNVLEVS